MSRRSMPCANSYYPLKSRPMTLNRLSKQVHACQRRNSNRLWKVTKYSPCLSPWILSFALQRNGTECLLAHHGWTLSQETRWSDPGESASKSITKESDLAADLFRSKLHDIVDGLNKDNDNLRAIADHCEYLTDIIEVSSTVEEGERDLFLHF